MRRLWRVFQQEVHRPRRWESAAALQLGFLLLLKHDDRFPIQWAIDMFFLWFWTAVTLARFFSKEEE